MLQNLSSVIMTIITIGSFSYVRSQTLEASEVLFLVKPEHKKELIADGILSASAFSDESTPEVISIDLKTDLDITLFQDEGKVEVAAKCFLGQSESAAEILKKLVLNANKRAGISTDLVKTIVTNTEVTIIYDHLDVSDVMSEKRFEISQCKSKVATDTIILDPVVGKYKMCSDVVVQLPDSIATGISALNESNLAAGAKLTGLKDLFESIKKDKSETSFCSVVTAISHKGKKGKIEAYKTKCEEVLVSKDLIIAELLDMPITPERKKESLCAISAYVNLMVFGF